MSGTSASVSVVAAGEAFLRPPFTAVQWKELEHQALVYKYLVAGLPVPLDLVFPIRRSLEDSSARFFHHPSLGYASYYGKKFDHEPGRCRRTDGKKWRCSKDAYPNSKYCERHMNRGRHRSRKTVESKSSSPSLSTVVSNIALENCCGSGSISSAGCRSFPSMRFCSKADSEGLYFESNSSKMHKEPVPCGTNNKEYRYLHGYTPEANEHSISLETSISTSALGANSNMEITWHLLPSPVSSMKPRNDSSLLGNSMELHVPEAALQSIADAAVSKQQPQYSFLGSHYGSQGSVKQEQNSMTPSFDEWPKTRDLWSDSTTQLSISIPMGSFEFSSSPNGEFHQTGV